MSDRWFIFHGATDTPALQKLNRLSRYPQGWAHGQGDQFSRAVVDSAKTALAVAASLDLQQTDVFPRRDGGLVVSVYVGADVHDFTLYANGTIEWLHELDDVDIDCRPMTLEEVGQKLVEIARTRWHSYGYLWQPITAHTKGDLRAQHLPSQASIGQFPALTGIVPMLPPVGPVST